MLQNNNYLLNLSFHNIMMSEEVKIRLREIMLEGHLVPESYNLKRLNNVYPDYVKKILCNFKNLDGETRPNLCRGDGSTSSFRFLEHSLKSCIGTKFFNFKNPSYYVLYRL